MENKIANLQKVIDTLNNLPEEIKFKEKNITMLNPSIDYSCNTALCIAGWYTVATTFDTEKPKSTYSLGKTLIAQDFGECLLDWAVANPKIWGNNNAHGLFCNFEAWNNPKSINDVINHLKSVKFRLTKYYKKHDFLESLKFWKINKEFVLRK